MLILCIKAHKRRCRKQKSYPRQRLMDQSLCTEGLALSKFMLELLKYVKERNEIQTNYLQIHKFVDTCKFMYL